MGNIIVSEIVGIIKELFLDYGKNKFGEFKERKALETFISNLEKWCSDYILKNETTLIASSDFNTYLRYQHPIENIFDFIQSSPNQTEESFLESICVRIECYLKEKHQLTQDDKRCIKEFIEGVANRAHKYYQTLISTNDTELHFSTNQSLVYMRRVDDNVERIIEQVTPKKPDITKITYLAPENTILRMVVPFKDLQEKLYFEWSAEDFFEVCAKEKHVVLLGEAGCGKSIAIAQLAARVSESEYYPMRYDLRNYVDETINQIIDSEYNGINMQNIFVIFDAYDEIGEQHKDDFVRRLNTFVTKNPKTIIVISTRNNFYSFPDDDGNNGLFTKFKEYGLYPITSNDIKTYIENNGVSETDFYVAVNDNGLNELISIPFYLRELLSIYKRCNRLPQKPEVMEEVIYNRFDKDRIKYLTTKKLEDNELELFTCIEELSFAIQCLRSTSIQSTDYQILFDIGKRNLIRYSGIFAKSPDKSWCFEHSIFREYLAAKYLDRLDISDIRNMVLNSSGKIHPSWTNVLSFLVLIRNNNDLLELLLDTDSEMIVRFERTRLDEAVRNGIFIRVMNDLAEKNMWFSQGLNSAHVLARFGQSRATCEYMIHEISSPRNFRALSNSIVVLTEFTELYGLENEIRTVLFNCLKTEDVREHEKYAAMDAIVSLGLDTSEIAEFIARSYSSDKGDEYRYGVLSYLSSSERFEAHFNIVIDEFLFSKRSSSRSISRYYLIMSIFSKVYNDDNLCSIIKLLSKQRSYGSIDKKEYDTIINNAAESYNNGNTALYDIALATFIEDIKYRHLFTERLVSFFEKTGTKNQAFLTIAETDLQVKSYEVINNLGALGDEHCYEYFLEMYCDNPERYAEIANNLALHFSVGSELYAMYKGKLAEHGVTIPEPRPFIDYNRARAIALQIHFDSLFNKEWYCNRVEELANKLGNERITFSDLKIHYLSGIEQSEEQYVEQQSLTYLQYDIDDYGDGDTVVIDAIYSISNWQTHLIISAYNLLLHNDSINISEDQRKYFESYCRSNIAKYDFQNDIQDTEDNKITYPSELRLVIFFSTLLNIVYDKETFLKMLFIPPWFFKTSNDNVRDEIPRYLTDHLSTDEIRKQIRCNLAEEKLCTDTVDMYIKYCKANACDWAVLKCEEVCNNPKSSSWRKRGAVDYLLMVKGVDYVYDKYLQSDDMDLIEPITNLTFKYKNHRLRERLEAISKSSTDGKAYLAMLIALNSKYGLARYYEIAKDEMKSTDVRDDTCIDSTLESIKSINDVDLLEELGKLRLLLFTPNFKDDGVINLYNCLFYAYKNIADNNYDQVKEHIDAALLNPEISEGDRGFCYTLLSEIESTGRLKCDTAWTIGDIKRFIIDHK